MCGSLKTWTWLGRVLAEAPPLLQVVLRRLQGHMLHEGSPGLNGSLLGPQVPSGSAGQPVRHFRSGVVAHHSSSGTSGSRLSATLSVPVVSNTSISVQAVVGSAFDPLFVWNHQLDEMALLPERQRISK